MIGFFVKTGDLVTIRKGQLIAYHSHSGTGRSTVERDPFDEPVSKHAPGRDRRRDKQHVTNVRRQQREAKRALNSLFA